jgi:hypothetical protein
MGNVFSTHTLPKRMGIDLGAGNEQKTARLPASLNQHEDTNGSIWLRKINAHSRLMVNV